MASVRYIILSACQSVGLYAQFGFESEAAAWIEKQGTNPCAYVYYRQGVGVAGFDNVSVVFGGSDPSAALRRVRDSLDRSLEFRSERQTEVGGYPALVMTARAKKRVYGFGGVARPVPPTPTVDYMYFEAQEANSTVALTSTLETAPDLEYSTDGVNWQEWQHTTAEGTHTFDTLTLTAVGDKVYFRGYNPNGLGTMHEGEEMPLFSHFDMTGKIAAGGNIMSLLDKNMETTEIPAFGFAYLFGYLSEENPNTSLTSAADMPAVTTIGDKGCTGMYAGCTSLTTAAAMPSVTTFGDNGCFGMYYDCTFNMSNDGTSLNFDFPTPPITAGETTYSTAYEVAQWMGNTNGFTNP